MARLNDAVSVPLDPTELLRRKYSRQNKEIARVNSTQCIRIRALENEISHLLTENLELREQILRLQCEAESYHWAENTNNVKEIKLKLEAKIREVSALVTTLGGDQERTPTKATGVADNLNRTPDRKDWKDMRILSETTGLEYDRLPPILEDKCYPRRTLELPELDAILSDPPTDNTDSPDIGPPPVSKFVEIPVHINLPERVGEDHVESSVIDDSRSIHLEQRRKRKDAMETLGSRRAENSEPNLGFGAEISRSLKSGAKRKLSSRDEEETATNIKARETPTDNLKTIKANDDCSRDDASTITEKRGSNASREIAAARGISYEKSIGNIGTNTRKALAPKSVNYDVANSPKKNIMPILLDEKQASKDLASLKEPRRKPSREIQKEHRMTSCNNHPLTDAGNVNREPRASSASDIMAPQSGTSTSRTEFRDISPASEIGLVAEGQRTSRRSKGSVSYAEPSLRDKMRRSTNELVDAVSREGKNQQIGQSRTEDEPPSVARKIKEEGEAGDKWKDLPLASSANIRSESPLIDESVSLESARHRRRKGSSTPYGDDGGQAKHRSTAISALLAGPKKTKREIKEHDRVSHV